jgi:D-amino-acid dehydrogenase
VCPNPATLLDSVPVSERRDVVVVGGGLVGVTLAYELASMGSGVTVVDARSPGRATAAGAGILSPVTSIEGDPELWPFLRGCGAHYPGLLERLAMDGVDVSGAAYGRCGLLSVSLRPHEDEWYGPFAEMVDRRSPGQAVEIAPEEASAFFPPLAPVHRALLVPSGARVDGRGMEGAVRAGAEARGVTFVAGTVTGLEGSDGRVTSVQVDTQGPVSCETLAVAGGAWTSALGEWLACPLPVGPTKGQIVHLGVDDASGDWPIVQPLLTHYLVPWPGGRIACGGTFESGAGFSTTATAAGLHELLRECLVVAPGLSEARYLETRVGLRPTSPDDHALAGIVPGWSNAFVVTGHGANGLLQGPYSSRLLAHAITGSAAGADEPPLPDGFDPVRFA